MEAMGESKSQRSAEERKDAEYKFKLKEKKYKEQLAQWREMAGSISTAVEQADLKHLKEEIQKYFADRGAVHVSLPKRPHGFASFESTELARKALAAAEDGHVALDSGATLSVEAMRPSIFSCAV